MKRIKISGAKKWGEVNQVSEHDIFPQKKAKEKEGSESEINIK